MLRPGTMSNPKSIPPPTRRKFMDRWDELDYLDDKIRYWARIGNRRRAAPFLARMSRLMKMRDKERNLPKARVLSKIAEGREDWPSLVKFKQLELELVERLRVLARTEIPLVRRMILRTHPPGDVAALYNELAMAQARAGMSELASASLASAARICRRHRLRLDVRFRKQIRDTMKGQT